jgi:hypothetical protein
MENDGGRGRNGMFRMLDHQSAKEIEKERGVHAPSLPYLPNLPDWPYLPNLPDSPDFPDIPDSPDLPNLPDSPDFPDLPDLPDLLYFSDGEDGTIGTEGPGCELDKVTAEFQTLKSKP